MSAKPCPQCGSPVPLQARFCGQCGCTFPVSAPEAPAARRIPTTIDEATADPPTVSAPRQGMATTIGHAAAQPGAIVSDPEATKVSPSGGSFSGMKTMLGHAAVAPASAPRNLGQTLLDPSPYGQSAEPGAASQRPTPMVPPPAAAQMAVTMNDPDAARRAQEAARAALAEAAAAKGAVNPPADDEATRRVDPIVIDEATKPATAPLGKTLMLGTPGADAQLGRVPAPLGDDAPTTRVALPIGMGGGGAPAPTTTPGTDPSPLSVSVMAPFSNPATTATTAGEAPAQPPAVGPGGVAATAAGSDKQTILGMPAVGMPGHATAPEGGQPALPPTIKTMLGVAMPGIAPTHDKAAEPAPAPVQRAGTLLGVAAPGIAPLHPGSPGHASPQSSSHQLVAGHQPGAAHQPAGAPAPPPIVPPPAPLVVEPLPERPQIQPRKGIPAVAAAAIVFVLVLLVGGVATLLVLRSGPPLTATPRLDETGRESLDIRCSSCPDGTVISLGASAATVTASAAVLPLPAPLSVGDNDLEMAIDRPAGGRDETVKVHVPVAYRVRADLSTLGAESAAITVRVEALVGTAVTVDGKSVELDASGKGAHAVDVSADVEGPSDDQKTIDKKIPFSIRVQGAPNAEEGQLAVRAVVAPLHMDAPGLELYTDRPTAPVAGQTKVGGSVTLDGQPLKVDPAGRFSVRVELPADGEKTVTIVASAPPLAPRTVRAKIVRVASLDAAARTLDAKSPLVFDAFGAEPASHVGKLVTVEGEIAEIRVAQGLTVMLVEEKKACAAKGACVVRVAYGEELKAARGDAVRLYGRLAGTVASNGKTIPDVEGSLVIARSGAR